MSISLACQECGYISAVEDEFAGQRVRCRKCGAPSEVPDIVPSRRRPATMDDFWRAAASVLAASILLFVILLTASRRSSAYNRPAPAAPAPPAAQAPPYDSALRESVVAYLALDDAPGLDAALENLGRVMARRGQPTTRGELLAGFLALAAVKEARTGQRPTRVRFLGAFGEPYKAIRTPGLTHVRRSRSSRCWGNSSPIGPAEPAAL